MIEGFGLPDFAVEVEGGVDSMGGGAFNGGHNFGQRERLTFDRVDQRSEDQVNVVRHNGYGVEVVFQVRIVKAALQNDVARAMAGKVRRRSVQKVMK